jgi:hypothetical protein
VKAYSPGYVEGLNDARTKLGAFFNTQLLKDSPLDDMTEIGHITTANPGLMPHPTMEVSMRARSIRSGHASVRRLILVSLLLFPWTVLAEEGVTLPLSKIVLYSR